MNHHSMDEEDNHLPMEVLNQSAEEMWSETSKDAPGSEIGNEGVRGMQKFLWITTGPGAGKNMEAWIQHLKDETREEESLYEVTFCESLRVFMLVDARGVTVEKVAVKGRGRRLVSPRDAL